MNIFIVDYVCTRGHIFFNEIHLNALKKLGHNLSFISRKGYMSSFEVNNFHEIPEEYFTCQEDSNLNAVQYHYYDIKKLVFAKKIVNKEKPDAVIVLTYDSASISFFRVRCPIYIINHVNIDFLNRWYRNIVTRIFPNNFIHVCLTKRTLTYMKKRYKHHRSVYIPHGYLENLSFKGNRENIIFCPATSSLDETLLYEIITDSSIIKYLSNNNIKLIIKTLKKIKDLPNCIDLINGYIDKELYKKLVQRSMAIFLPYNQSFNFRASGIFFEAITYGTPIITNNIPTFDEYADQVSYKYQIDDSKGFLQALHSINNLRQYYSNIETLNPSSYWNQVLSENI